MLNDFFKAMADGYDVEVADVAGELGVSNDIAADVVYLRTRSRWTPELEVELIRRRQTGESINMCDFGCTPETGQRLLDEAMEGIVKR